jgi:hypothetical protein
MAMPHVPHWVGFAGFVVAMIFCLAFLAGQLWAAVLLLIPGFALVVLENRYQRGLLGTGRD